MRLVVERSMGLVTLQDGGRRGWRRFGVPPGGAWHRWCFALANAVLGNLPGSTCVEVYGSVHVRATEAGHVGFAALSGRAVPVATELSGAKFVELAMGELLEISGWPAYLSLPGGIGCNRVLGSASGQQAVPGLALAALDPTQATGEQDVSALMDAPQRSPGEQPLRCEPGPQWRLCDQAELQQATFRVSHLSSRMGIRLDSNMSGIAEELPSEPATIGAVQLTPSGQLLILGPDGPTVGGYPKVAVVLEQDLDRVAELKAGQLVRLTISS